MFGDLAKAKQIWSQNKVKNHSKELNEFLYIPHFSKFDLESEDGLAVPLSFIVHVHAYLVNRLT